MKRLVKKSLAVNPELAGSRDVDEFVRDLQSEIGNRAPSRDPTDADGCRTRRRAQMLDLFTREMVDVYCDKSVEIKRRIKELETELCALKNDYLEDIAYLLLSLLGENSKALSEVVYGKRDLWAKMGCTQQDLTEVLGRASSAKQAKTRS
jgi:hypothetical protein